MSIALLVNASPYGSELPYNALRVAAALQLDGHVELLLMGDAVNTARRVSGPRTRRWRGSWSTSSRRAST